MVASVPAAASVADESLVSQVAYSLRFEVAFTVCALVFWAIGAALRRRWDNSKVRPKIMEEPTRIPTSTMQSSASKRAVPARQRAAGGGAAQVSTPSGSTIIRRGAGPEDVIRNYENAASRGTVLSTLTEGAQHELFAEVFSAAVRTGRAAKLPQYIRDATKLGITLSPQQLESVVKMCTAKKLFKEALLAFDAFGFDSADTSAGTASAWSCLLFCAVEAGDFGRCEEFYKALRQLREPSCEDFMNMLRYIVHMKNPSLLGPLLKEVRKSSSPPDNIAYNRALAVCIAAEQLGMAEELLSEMRQHEGVVDVITYNTLMKGYSQGKQIEKCFSLHEEMKAHGIVPSEVTFGILLDACISADLLDRAGRVFKDFQASGCTLNAVLYTTLLKGLARAGQLNQAMQVFEQMCASEVAPDLVSFSVIIKVHCDAGHIEVALQLLERMTHYGLAPDEIVFNNLLLGCAERKNSALGCRIFSDMQKHGLAPSHVTLSIMVKIFVKCREVDAALDLLNTSPEKLGLKRESRLYVQLAQACIRDRQGKRVKEVCEALLRHCPSDNVTNGKLVVQCVSFNMLDTGVELLELILSHGCRVSTQDANSLLSAAIKKQKSNTTQSVLAAMDKSQITVDAQLRSSARALCG